MSSFLTDAQKDALGNQFFSLHDTFARPIVIYKTAKEIVMYTNPANNYLFEAAPFNDIAQFVQVSGVFNARVLYGKKQDLTQFATTNNNGATDQVNIRNDEGTVRIQVDATGRVYLFDAKQVTFDGNIFDIDTQSRPHGLFPPKFYSYYLTRIN